MQHVTLDMYTSKLTPGLYIKRLHVSRMGGIFHHKKINHLKLKFCSEIVKKNAAHFFGVSLQLIVELGGVSRGQFVVVAVDIIDL